MDPTHAPSAQPDPAGSDVVDQGETDRSGRAITLRPVDAGNWREIADLAPEDGQREFVAPLAARYLLLSTFEDTWTSLGIYADQTPVGHAMWAVDDDGSHWIGGVLVDASVQGQGVGRAAMATLVRWLSEKPDCDVVRLSYAPENRSAASLYQTLGFVATGEIEDDEIVVELRV